MTARCARDTLHRPRLSSPLLRSVLLVLVAQSRPRARGLCLRLHRAARVRPGPDRSRRPVRRGAGRTHPRRADGTVLPPTCSTCASVVSPEANAGCSASRSRPTRDGASSSTSPTDPATPSSRASGVERSAGRQSRVALRSAMGRRDGRSSRSRSRITTAAHLAFGPDGYLYIGLGDGGSGDDPDHRAQNPSELLGKMLRIDVNVPDTHATGYQVPADNPFVSGPPVAARPEIWAFGLRNPWRYSFDDPARGGTGASSSATSDRTRSRKSTTSRANRGGRNYGWRNREGAHDNVTSRPPAFLPLIDPILEYGRAAGQSITGGYVYRGRALGAAYQRPLLLRRLRAGPRLVDCPDHRRAGRGARLGPDRAHGRSRRPEPSATSARSASTPTASCTSSACRAGSC